MTALLALPLLFFVASPGDVAHSSHASADFALTADPDAPQWKDAPRAIAPNDNFGKPVPSHRTEIRSRWTNGNLYLLFVCPYEKLYSKPNPVTTSETDHLWEWDVAEVFIGWDFAHPHRYKEFEVSPHGEWVDLDIDYDHALPGGGVSWNSGFKVKTRIDQAHKIWYGEMEIPFASIAQSAPAAGQKFRVNFYRMQGPGTDEKRTSITWQPTGSASFHVPDKFGILELN